MVVGGTGISLSVRPSVCLRVYVSVCVQNTSVCQSAGGGIQSHLVTALVNPGKVSNLLPV